SLTVHEFAHSLAAISLGDDTPRRDGRLTLNPLKHVDLIGFVMLIVAGFGWAKPVRIDASKLRKPRRDEILISLAGPVSNLILAVLAVILVWAVLKTSALPSRRALAAFGGFMTELAVINVSLAVFNMIPIPPLDGSHVLLPFLGKVNPALAATYFRYGSYVLLAVILFGFVTKIQILPIGRLTYAIVRWMFGLIGIT
ncbi:MAG: site-2 protease family protein, partial [Spirochaetia bacterium]